MRAERPASWWAGFGLGVVTSVLILFTWGLVVPFAAAVFVAVWLLFRNLAFPAGALVGFGSSWLLLLGRAQIDCWLRNLEPNQGCHSENVAPFLSVSILVIGIGLVLALAARRRAKRSLTT